MLRPNSMTTHMLQGCSTPASNAFLATPPRTRRRVPSLHTAQWFPMASPTVAVASATTDNISSMARESSSPSVQATGWEAFGPEDDSSDMFVPPPRQPPAPLLPSPPAPPAPPSHSNAALKPPAHPASRPMLLQPASPGSSTTAPSTLLFNSPQQGPNYSNALMKPSTTLIKPTAVPGAAGPGKVQRSKPKVKFPVQPSDAAKSYNNLPVKVEAPENSQQRKPIQNFNILRFTGYKYSRTLLLAMQALRYQSPTPIQSYTIPYMAHGADVCAVSPTGSGKTAAYLIPLLGQLTKISRDGGPRYVAYPSAVIIAPTRELVDQIHEEVMRLVKGSHLKAVPLHGGDSMVSQVLAMRGGVDLIVATPARLLDHMCQRRSVHLGRTFLMVLDEADKLLGLGFEAELKLLLTHPQLQQPCQTCMFSTSMPAELRQVAQQYLRPEAVHIAVGDDTGVAPLVTHHVVPVAADQKLPRLKELLSSCAGVGHQPGLTMIYTNSLEEARAVHDHVVGELGISAGLLHRELPQVARDEAMQCFRYGVTPVLVSTGLSARGVDVPDVVQVINWSTPPDITEYVLRCGRTGRGGRHGTAITLFTPKDAKLAPGLVRVMHGADQAPPDWLLAVAEQAGRKVRPVHVHAPASREPVGDEQQQLEQDELAGAAAGGLKSGYLNRAVRKLAAQKASAFPWPDLLPQTPQSAETSKRNGSRNGHVSGVLPDDEELLRQWHEITRHKNLGRPARRAARASPAGGDSPSRGAARRGVAAAVPDHSNTKAAASTEQLVSQGGDHVVHVLGPVAQEAGGEADAGQDQPLHTARSQRLFAAFA